MGAGGYIPNFKICTYQESLVMVYRQLVSGLPQVVATAELEEVEEALSFHL